MSGVCWCKASAQENMQPTIASRRHWQWGLRNMWTLGRCRKRKHTLSYDFFSFVVSFASTSASVSLSKEREEAGMRKFKSLDKRQSRCVSKSQAWFCQERRRFKENLEVRSSEHSKLILLLSALRVVHGMNQSLTCEAIIAIEVTVAVAIAVQINVVSVNHGFALETLCD